MSTGKIYKGAPRALVVIPVLAFVLSGLLVSAFGPYYLAGRMDPDYFELLNSLSLLSFHAPANFDHPGTTVHVLGAFVIFCRWTIDSVFGSWLPLQSAVLLHPEDYLHAINLFFRVLASLSMYYAARVVYRRSDSLCAAIVLQVSFFLFSETLFAQSRVTPEALLAAASFALMIPLADTALATELSPAGQRKQAAVSGALFAFGVVTKLSFLPLLSVVLLFKGFRQKIWFFTSSVAAGLFLLLPGVSGLSGMVAYFFSFLTHSSYYGAGSFGLPAAAILKSNARNLLDLEPYLVVLFILYSVALVFAHVDRHEEGVPRLPMLRRVLWSGWIAILVQAALVIQHYRSYYLVPSLLYVSFVNAMMTAYYLKHLKRLPRVAKAAVVLCGLIFGVAALLHTERSVTDWAETEWRDRADLAVLEEKLKSMPECLQIGYDQSVLPLRALHFGNTMSGVQQGRTLAGLYPDSLFYSWNEGKAFSFLMEDKTQSVTDLVMNGHCVLLEGYELSAWSKLGAVMVLPANLRYEPVMTKGAQGIYRLTYTASNGPQGKENTPR